MEIETFSPIKVKLFCLLIDSYFTGKAINENFHSYILRAYQIFLKDINDSEIPDFPQIKVMILRNFLSNNEKAQLIALENLMQKFLSKNSISQKFSILYLLALISQKNGEQFYSKPRLTNSLSLSQINTNNSNNNNYYYYYNEAKKNQTFFSDEKLIKDLLFILLGSDGTFLRLNKTTKNFEIVQSFHNNPQINCPILFKSSSQKTLALKIAETGYLVRKIGQETKEILKLRKTGKVISYFTEAISEESKGFYALINSIETQIQFCSSHQQAVSLKSLYFLINKENERIKWINILWDSAMKSGYQGFQILNLIHHFFSYGNPDQKELFGRIFLHSIQTLWIFLAEWLSLGVINDQNDEFFIGVKESQEKTTENQEKRNLWIDKFVILWEKAPNFFTATLIEKILVCGKASFFLRKFCWNFDQNLNTKDFIFNLSDLKEFPSWIDSITKRINENAVKTLFDEFHLLDELNFMKNYLLMGNGFFSDLFLEEAAVELKKPCNQIYKHILMGILDKTLKKTVENKSQRKVLIEKLSIVYVKRSTLLDIGWDLISMDFKVKEPIEQIISDREKKVYWEIYNFLAKTKRFLLEIREIWKKTVLTTRLLNKSTSYFRSSGKKLLVILKQAEFTRNLMSFFLNNFLEFLLIEGIENEWNCFSFKLLNKCQSIDEIILLHQSFLEALQRKFFLLKEDGNINNCIMRLYEHIKTFVLVNNSILDDLQSTLLRIKEKSLKKQLKSVFNEDDDLSMSNYSFEEKEEFDDNLEDFQKNLKFKNNIPKIREEFQKTLIEFLKLVEKNQTKSALSFKLNYNEFLDLHIIGEKTNYLKFEDLESLLSPMKTENSRNLVKRQSSPDIKKEYSNIFEESDDLIINEGSQYINVFND